MAFAQLTYRKSLRNIATCLSAQAVKLYHTGFHQPIVFAHIDYNSDHSVPDNQLNLFTF